MTNMNSNARQVPVAISNDAHVLVSTQVKTWMAVFALTALALFAAQPTAIITGSMALCMMFTMVLIVHGAVANFKELQSFELKQQMINIIAPVQFACLIWMAVQAGRMIAGTPLVTSSLAALAALALIILVDAILSLAFLFAAERGEGISGVSFAALISSKYTGLLGKTV
jgi:hypothetical protein